jgi:predicted NBD/HSP70 family sugar kinase
MTEGIGASDALAVDEVAQLIQRAEQGDTQALPALRQWLDAHPDFWEGVADLAQMTQDTLVQMIRGEENLFTHEIHQRKLRAMYQELAGSALSPLEALLVERIVICWLHLHHAEGLYVQHVGDLTPRQADFHQRRISKAHSRYLSAIRTLAQVRRLGVPAVQVNIGAQQVNVAQ